jgi:hypothetical protein
MWVIKNQTPFSAERAWVRDRKGAEVWLVAVKGTFLINSDGKLNLAEEQEEVHLAPAFRGAPEATSLQHDSDLHHKKNSTDILVEGHAWAPDGKPVRKLDVSLKIGPVHKVLRIIGDRIWKESIVGLSRSSPLPFVKMPITYERAFGGTDQISKKRKHHGWEARNPVGCGFATRPEHLIGKTLPNIEDPACLIQNWDDKPKPAGFGPIAGHWSPRVELAGTYDQEWEQNRLPLLPEDFNDGFYQCAPEDQQVPGFLKGGERVQVTGMTPNGLLVFHLPRITLGFTTYFDGSSQAVHRGVLHTVRIIPDENKLIMVWHTNLECHHRVLQLVGTTIRIKQRLFVSQKANEDNSWEFA